MSDTTPGEREDLLQELALRLASYPGDPRNEDPQLLVGKLPDKLAISVPMPEGSRVLGTLIRGAESLNVLFLLLLIELDQLKVLDYRFIAVKMREGDAVLDLF
jgi:hypothetical protein